MEDILPFVTAWTGLEGVMPLKQVGERQALSGVTSVWDPEKPGVWGGGAGPADVSPGHRTYQEQRISPGGLVHS